VPSITPIRLNISRRLLDSEFRKVFFRTQATDEIAMSIRNLRMKRNKRQKELAKEAGMQQSEISRIEQANYGRWTLRTLFKMADVLGARLRITLDPIEEVIEEYKRKESEYREQEQRFVYSRPDADSLEIRKRGMDDTMAMGAQNVLLGDRS
jgi:transcriptional regulator with XRE-family HTH domain